MKNIFIILSYILILYIKCNNDTNKIIFFELDNKEDLIIKTIFLNQYNAYFNFLIDTMGFISGLLLSKKLSYDFILGNTFSPINSYRTFEGHKGELKFNINNKNGINVNYTDNSAKNNFYFPISIFKVYNKINFYDKNIEYNGIIGLALNYTDEVLLDESYFFGEDKKYSIINFLYNDLELINRNIFSIYKDKFILGDINNLIDHNIINYCECVDKIYDSFIYFFWNCEIKTILLNNKINEYYKDIKISLLFDSLLKENILSTNPKIVNIIINQINDIFGNITICHINKNNPNKIFCLYEYYDKINELNLKIILNDMISIELPFYLFIKNWNEKYFCLVIDIDEFNVDKNQNIIKIGKKIFDYYYVVFDQHKKRIGLQKLENFSLNLDEKYNYKNIFKLSNYKLDKYTIYLIKVLLFVNIAICIIGFITVFLGTAN